MTKVQLFVDMDGVLADFDAHHETVLGVRCDKDVDNVDWNRVRAVKDFYLNIPPMADMEQLWRRSEAEQLDVLDRPLGLDAQMSMERGRRAVGV